MPTSLRVFDEIALNDASLAAYATPKFDYLNTSARPEAERVRANVEEWFGRYPAEHAAELRSRLRTDQQHETAFFELFIHEVLTRLGWCITIHPAVPGTTRRPDFLALRGENRLLVEATTVTEAGIVQASASRTATLIDALNRRIHSPNFFVTIHIKYEGAGSPSARQIAKRTTNWLKTLDPDQVSRAYERTQERAEFTVDEDGWLIDFRVVPKKPEARGRPGVRPIGGRMYGGWIDTRAPLCDAVRTKATAYGNLDVPFLIAVNVATEFDADDISVMEALFGRETFSIGPRGVSDMRRQPNGAWFGPEGPRNTRNSVVLVVNHFAPWSLASANSKLYHNPFAAIPCSTDVLPFAYAAAEGDEMKSQLGVSIRDLFGLPESWPRDVV
jgi:hypothetical protein